MHHWYFLKICSNKLEYAICICSLRRKYPSYTTFDMTGLTVVVYLPPVCEAVLGKIQFCGVMTHLLQFCLVSNAAYTTVVKNKDRW